jgi:hypothetical protein
MTSVPCPGFPLGCTCRRCQAHYIRTHANSETYHYAPGQHALHAGQVADLIDEAERITGGADDAG